jgi:hypothetical protein
MGANTFKGTTTVSAGATLQGTGSVVGPLVNNGTVRPLDPSTGSPGTFQAGKYTQSATGTLDIAIGGTPASGKYGQLSTTGKATLAGTLAVSLVDGFVIPTGSSTYDDVLTFTTSKSGDFTSFSFNGNSCSSGGAETWSCGFGLTFTEVFDADSLDLTVLSVATPEPGTVAVLASGLLGLLAWRRRRT